MSKRLVLIGEGQGDVAALPCLVRKLLQQKEAHQFYVDSEVLRVGNPDGLIKWEQAAGRILNTEWIRRLELARRRPGVGGVLAVFDGDANVFPAGTSTPFCATKAARVLAKAGSEAGAGFMFSLAVVFAQNEFESWLIAGAESLKDKTYADGRRILKSGVETPVKDPELRGKRWLEMNSTSYRPARDQSLLTDFVDIKVVQSKNLRSFRRLENALDQLIASANRGVFISTPSW